MRCVVLNVMCVTGGERCACVKPGLVKSLCWYHSVHAESCGEDKRPRPAGQQWSSSFPSALMDTTQSPGTVGGSWPGSTQTGSSLELWTSRSLVPRGCFTSQSGFIYFLLLHWMEMVSRVGVHMWTDTSNNIRTCEPSQCVESWKGWWRSVWLDFTFTV